MKYFSDNDLPTATYVVQFIPSSSHCYLLFMQKVSTSSSRLSRVCCFWYQFFTKTIKLAFKRKFYVYLSINRHWYWSRFWLYSVCFISNQVAVTEKPAYELVSIKTFIFFYQLWKVRKSLCWYAEMEPFTQIIPLSHSNRNQNVIY